MSCGSLGSIKMLGPFKVTSFYMRPRYEKYFRDRQRRDCRPANSPLPGRVIILIHFGKSLTAAPMDARAIIRRWKVGVEPSSRYSRVRLLAFESQKSGRMAP